MLLLFTRKKQPHLSRQPSSDSVNPCTWSNNRIRITAHTKRNTKKEMFTCYILTCIFWGVTLAVDYQLFQRIEYNELATDTGRLTRQNVTTDPPAAANCAGLCLQIYTVTILWRQTHSVDCCCWPARRAGLPWVRMTSSSGGYKVRTTCTCTRICTCTCTSLIFKRVTSVEIIQGTIPLNANFRGKF